MTVADVIKRLEQFPPKMEVMICGGNDEFTYGEVNEIIQQKVRFCEDQDYPDKEPFCDVDCVIIRE